MIRFRVAVPPHHEIVRGSLKINRRKSNDPADPYDVNQSHQIPRSPEFPLPTADNSRPVIASYFLESLCDKHWSVNTKRLLSTPTKSLPPFDTFAPAMLP